MYTETLHAVSEVAVKKMRYLREHPVGYLVAAMLAGAYVGVGVFLAFAVGAPLAETHSPWLKPLMGASFTIALALVVFAGAELFTGNNMVLPVGWWRGKNRLGDVLTIWIVSWAGNLLGALLLALLLYYSGIFGKGAELALVLSKSDAKMTMPVAELFARGILCNWLVCLAVWCTYRMQTEIGKLVMIFWCLYAFVACGFEHSVANMTLLSLAMLLPHDAFTGISWTGMGYNLLWVSLGNILGGGLFVAGAYWTASRANALKGEAREAQIPTNS